MHRTISSIIFKGALKTGEVRTACRLQLAARTHHPAAARYATEASVADRQTNEQYFAIKKLNQSQY